MGLHQALAWLLAASPLLAGLSSGSGKARPEAVGWAGPDLAAARTLAARSDRPLLVFVRGPDCAPCDHLETVLTTDSRIAPLTLPFVRLRVSLAAPEGAATARSLRVHRVPAVLLLGPGGMEASRRDGAVERAWLVEQLQIVAHRHAVERSVPQPTQRELTASLMRLLEWGDLDGAASVRRMLQQDSEATGYGDGSAGPADAAADETLLDGLASRLTELVDPGRIRQAAHETAQRLEAGGRPALALRAYQQALELLAIDPVTDARAAFLAARHGLQLEPRRRRLMEARDLHPESLPLLLALARVAEASGRIYQAFHAAEAAAVYAPEDAWTALELRRLRLLVRLKHPRSQRDPA